MPFVPLWLIKFVAIIRIAEVDQFFIVYGWTRHHKTHTLLCNFCYTLQLRMNDDIAICEFDMHAFFLEKYAIHSSPTTYAYDIKVQLTYCK